MKNNYFLKLIFFPIQILLIFISCREESLAISNTKEQQNHQQAKINYKKLEEIFGLNEIIQKSNQNKFARKSKSNLSDSIAVEKDAEVIEMLLEDGNTMYSIILDNNDNTKKEQKYSINNLHILIENGKEYFLLAKYIPTDGKPFFDFRNFVGEIQYYDLDGKKLGNLNYPFPKKNGATARVIAIYTVESGCYAYVVLILDDGRTSIQSSTYICGGGSSGTTGTSIGSGGLGSYFYGYGTSTGSGGTGGGTGDSSGSTSLPALPNIPSEDFYERKMYTRYMETLLSPQIDFLIKNIAISDQIFYYLRDNLFSSESKAFITNGILFFMENSYADGYTYISWQQFQSWFMNSNGTPNLNLESWFITKSEGQDGEIITNLDNILSTFNYQTRQMPTYSQYVANYPKLDYPGYPGYYKQMPASQVYEMVGDPLKSLYISKGGDNGIYRNACTVRWSLAMNKLGILIPNNSESLRGADVNGQSRYYYIRATTANDAMVKIFGETKPTNILIGNAANDPKTVMDFLKGKTGIYTIINADPNKAKYTGHVDIIQNGHVPGGSNHENVPGGIKSIKIWEFTP